ncbi:MFS transporter [Paucibacter sp. B51]|uniref:MFS transporter n=1 Tax=Paucibacter sp. B51 TaxID=2993315 RepID=UPI0022EBB9F7|nr:MFS transporter [Paucibacter sp. B51]
MSTAAKTLLDSERRTLHPSFFMFLIAPFGATTGYTAVCLAYLLTQAQVGAESVAGLLALAYLPQTWKFLWAPVVDLSLSRKTWYVLGLVGIVLSMLLVGSSPLNAASMTRLTIWVLVMGTASTFLAMAVDSLMAHQTPEHAKGRAAGWFQAGNLGGGGLGGGAALWLIQSGGLSPQMGAAALAGLCVLCAWPIFWVSEGSEPAAEQAADQAEGATPARIGQRLRETWADLWSVVRSRNGALAMLLVFLPLGTGSMANMYSIMATEWQASANTVALVTGTVAGLLSALGCLIGGYVCDRMNRQMAYVIFGLLLAGASVAMAVAPHTEWHFVLWTSLYSLITGLCYAGFSAVTLEAIGKGAAATKYNLMASLSNTPIGWTTALYGWVFAQFGGRLTLLAELALTVPAALLFVWVFRRGRARAAAML